MKSPQLHLFLSCSQGSVCISSHSRQIVCFLAHNMYIEYHRPCISYKEHLQIRFQGQAERCSKSSAIAKKVCSQQHMYWHTTSLHEHFSLVSSALRNITTPASFISSSLSTLQSLVTSRVFHIYNLVTSCLLHSISHPSPEREPPHP